MNDLSDYGLQVFSRQINEAVSALIELNAMLAENTKREAAGDDPAYGYSEIIELQSQYGLDHNGIIEKYRKF